MSQKLEITYRAKPPEFDASEMDFFASLSGSPLLEKFCELGEAQLVAKIIGGQARTDDFRVGFIQGMSILPQLCKQLADNAERLEQERLPEETVPMQGM